MSVSNTVKDNLKEPPPDKKWENVDNVRNREIYANEPVTIKKKIKNLLSFITIEPFLLSYILPSIISALAVQKINMEKACRADLSYSEDICNLVISGSIDNSSVTALDEAQTLNVDMTIWKQPLQSGIPAIMILFVGAWSDRTGNRKALMMIPLIGEILSSIGMLLATYYFLEWPLWATALIEVVPPAFTGGISIALMGSYSYIADVTTLESRTLRMGIAAIIVTLSIPFGTAISGYLTEAIGYYGIFGLGLGLYTFGLIYTYYTIKDVRRTKTEGNTWAKIIQFFHVRNVWDTFSLIIMSRGRKLAQIILVVCAHIVIIGPVSAEGQVLYFYVTKKFSMSVVDFSWFLTYSLLMGLAGTTVAVTVFSKWLKMHDSLLGIIATACKVVSSFVYGLAPNTTWFYTGPVFDFFGNSGVTAIRSLGTKIVEPDQVAKMCSLIGFVEAIVPVIYTPAYSKLYGRTLNSFPGAFYILGGIMTVPAFFIFIVLYTMYKKQQRDIVKNPAAKDAFAHENAVTSL